MKKPYNHICKNCYYYSEKDKTCLNCDSPSDIRKKEPKDICDGGEYGCEKPLLCTDGPDDWLKWLKEEHKEDKK